MQFVSASAPEPAQSIDDVSDSISRHAAHISKLAAQEAQRSGHNKCAFLASSWASSAQEHCVPCIIDHGCASEARRLGASPSIASAAAVDVAPLADSTARVTSMPQCECSAEVLVLSPAAADVAVISRPAFSLQSSWNASEHCHGCCCHRSCWVPGDDGRPCHCCLWT